MTEAERRMLRLHAELPLFQRKLDTAQQVIADALAAPLPGGERWYCALSGGVDSAVVFDLLWRAGFRGPVLWGDDGADFPQTLTFLAETEARYGFHLTRIRCLDPWRAWCEEMDRPDLAETPDEPGVWFNPPVWEATWCSLTKDAPAAGYGGVFLGLLGTRRKDGGESTARWRVLHGGVRPLYQVKGEGGMWHCSPLAHWTKRDVWCLPYEIKVTTPEGAIPIGAMIERGLWNSLPVLGSQGWTKIRGISRGWVEELAHIGTRSTNFAASKTHLVYTVDQGWRECAQIAPSNKLIVLPKEIWQNASDSTLDRVGNCFAQGTMGYPCQRRTSCPLPRSSLELFAACSRTDGIKTSQPYGFLPCNETDSLNDYRSGIYCWNCRWRGMDWNVYNKTYKGIWARPISRYHQYQPSIDGVPINQVRYSHQRPNLNTWDQIQTTRSIGQCTQNSRHSEADHAFYDRQKKAGRVDFGPLREAAESSLSCAIWRGGFAGLSGTQSDEPICENPTSIYREYRPSVVYDLQTESGDFFANGVLVHNSYVASSGLAYNPVYDRLAELGVPLEDRRVAPLTCYRVLHLGASAVFRRGWPGLYNQLSAVFPALRGVG